MKGPDRLVTQAKVNLTGRSEKSRSLNSKSFEYITYLKAMQRFTADLSAINF
jgi:hypothetical protein